MSQDFYASMGAMRKQGGEFRQQADKLESSFDTLQRLKRKTSFSRLSGEEVADLRSLLNFAETGLERRQENGGTSTLKHNDLYRLKGDLNQYSGFSVTLNPDLANTIPELLELAESGLNFGMIPDDFV